MKVVMLEVAKECRGGSYITTGDLAPHGEESVEFLVNDELFYHAEDLTVPARPDSGIDTRQGPSGPEPKPDADDDESASGSWIRTLTTSGERQKSRVRRI